MDKFNREFVDEICEEKIYCSNYPFSFDYEKCSDIKTVPHDFIGPLQKGTVREAKK